MDCKAVISEIADYFVIGYSREGMSFFSRPLDALKNSLREKYFDSYREELKKKNEGNFLVPRTGNFISVVYAEILEDIFKDKDFKASISNGLVDRVFANLRDRGYGYLFENEEDKGRKDESRKEIA